MSQIIGNRQGDGRGWKLKRGMAMNAMVGAWIVALTVLGGWTINEMRTGALHEAQAVSENILDVASRSIERDIELYDLSLKAVVERTGMANVMALEPELRRMAIFDNSSSAKGLGRIHYTDASGNLLDTSNGDPGKVNVADRDYFIAHRDYPSLGSYVSKPITGRIGKERYLVLSRRLNHADGSFAGVVVGQIKLAYLREFFQTIKQGEGGQIALYRLDGVVMVREPKTPSDRRSDDVSIAGTPAQASFAAETSGSFVSEDGEDGPERMHVFRRVSGTTLVLDVGVSTETALAGWRSQATWMVVALIGLVASLLVMVALNQRELTLRQAAERDAIAAKREAVRMSETDALTGLANRRVFDRAMEIEISASATTGSPLSVVVVDADHFKRLNDTLGHASGDEALKGIANNLQGMTQRSGEIACRVGGEEFAVILPGLDEDAAGDWAAKVRQSIASAVIGDPSNPLTVSMGVAQVSDGDKTVDMMERADAALYVAKRTGRNKVVPWSVVPPDALAA